MAETEAYTTESHMEETDADTTGSETESYTTDTDSVPELTPEEMARLLEPDPELTDDEKALRALHLVCCRELTEYDPKSKAYVCTRFSSFNIALFDLDEESEATHGPPLQELTNSQWRSIHEASVNVISLKVIQSDVGYPINVFGTVLARDEVDYKCVYLFRRDRDNSQYIESPEDMLTLTGPSRGLIVSDTIFFEINLKIRGNVVTDDKDFSKGVIEHYIVPLAKGPKTELLTSWLSTVELVLAPAPYAVAATVKINILNGPCDPPFRGKVTAWTAGDAETHIILHDYENKAMDDFRLIKDGGSIALSRNLVAVPVPNSLYDEYEEIVLTVCFTTSDDEDECTSVTLQYPQEEKVCNHGSYELKVEVTWTSILEGPFGTDIDKRWSSVPQKLLLF
ncbi:uncharacterized protein [Triticum aestivum]|uniref:DUF6598 domain-containing protein n=3 Tax=Triticum TaxID=4564 RepID=A0A9R1RIV2_TRITD|nr:uncharacterized protein LOC123039107 [Triticum aestivum]VAH42945.1 unnamed protein product [Triticum turgidum subsp. durum]